MCTYIIRWEILKSVKLWHQGLTLPLAKSVLISMNIPQTSFGPKEITQPLPQKYSRNLSSQELVIVEHNSTYYELLLRRVHIL